jgi:hypothetical protein
MKATEFIKMMKQDIETHSNKAIFSQVVEVMEYVLSDKPNADIPHDRTPEGCYSTMKDHANKNKSGGFFGFGYKDSVNFVAEYLGVKQAGDNHQVVSEIQKSMVPDVNLDDFF